MATYKNALISNWNTVTPDSMTFFFRRSSMLNQIRRNIAYDSRTYKIIRCVRFILFFAPARLRNRKKRDEYYWSLRLSVLYLVNYFYCLNTVFIYCSRLYSVRSIPFPDKCTVCTQCAPPIDLWYGHWAIFFVLPSVGPWKPERRKITRRKYALSTSWMCVLCVGVRCWMFSHDREPIRNHRIPICLFSLYRVDDIICNMWIEIKGTHKTPIDLDVDEHKLLHVGSMHTEK